MTSLGLRGVSFLSTRAEISAGGRPGLDYHRCAPHPGAEKPMSLRLKLFLLPALAIAAAAGLVELGSEQYARRQAEQAEQQRTQTLVAQFQRELAQRGDEVARAVQSVADAEGTLRMALDLTRTQADPSIYANDARGLANIYHLDFLELDAADGTLISSSHWAPASGYRNDWVSSESDWNHQSAFLSRVQLPDKVELGLLAVRAVRVGERNLYVIGGWRFDRDFLRTMALPEGMRALLYASLESRFVPEALSGPEGPVAQAEQLAPLVESLQHGEKPGPRTIQSSEAGGNAETFVAVPLQGRRGELLGALLVGSSQQSVAALVNYTRSLALLAAGAGVLFSLLLSGWFSARVSRPLAQLADAARELRSGKGTSGAKLSARGETAAVATALNDLSTQLARDRERLVQRERVAARREMARRFASDLRESIFPLHMAAEDLVHAREETSERFDEIFFESTTAMRAELDRLKNVATRFGEFARMPRPRPVPVNVNEFTRVALKAIEPQFHTAGRPPVTPEVHLGEPDPTIEADPDLLRAALENLLLHCLDAMPAGGTLAIRTREKDGLVRIEVSAKGASFSAEDCQRLFTPAGSVPEGMTGLGLATAHAVVNEHGGRISAELTADSVATIRLEFPAVSAGKSRAAPAPVPQEAARLVTREKVRHALPPAPAEATPPEPPAAVTPSEPVQVMIVATEAATASGETSPATETPGPPAPDKPNNSTRARRGLLFTE
jgi:signal transduction histidine kinase